MKKLGICIAALLALLALTAGALALTEPQTAVMHGCSWGMTADQVREVMGQETQYSDRGSGQTMLLYFTEYDDHKTQINFLFSRDRYLYNISEFTIGETYQDAYTYYSATFRQQFGEPSTDGGDGTEAGAMIAQIEGPDTETGYKGWKLDPLTLVVLSKDEAQQVTYVEYRLKTGWGIGMDTLTTNPFSVDGIRFGASERMVQALENPDAYASDGSVITGYRCDNRTFAGRAAALHFVFENEGVVRFAYIGNSGAEDFAPFLSEISAQYGAPYVGEDLIALWEIEDGVICALSTSAEGTCVEFFQSQGGGQ